MSLNLEKYQQFATKLEQLSSDFSDNLLDVPTLRQRLLELQQLFIQEIAPLTDLNSLQQSYQTEISKQLRLLEIDIMFLQGARQSATAQVRIKNIIERISTLIRYCQAIIQPENKAEE
jgi:hypothetical protein